MPPLDDDAAQPTAGRPGRDLVVITTSATVGVPVLTVHGDLTTRTYTRLRETAYGQLAQAPRLVVLDLAQLTALDTDGVALLVKSPTRLVKPTSACASS